MAVPTAPTDLAATVIGSTTITVTWTDNASDETSQAIESSLADADDWTEIATPAADAVTADLTGFTPNTLYDLRVKAVNGEGSSTYDTLQDVLTLPAVPTGASLVAGNAEVVVTFTEPADGAETYTVTVSPGGETEEDTGSPITVAVANGRACTATVHATNATGDTAESDPSSSQTTGVPATVNVNGTIGTRTIIGGLGYPLQ